MQLCDTINAVVSRLKQYITKLKYSAAVVATALYNANRQLVKNKNKKLIPVPN